MAIDRTVIVNGAANTQAYQAGVKMYNANKASVYMEKTIWQNQVTVNGVVKEGTSSSFVKLTLSEDSIVASYCTCGQFFRGLCAHGVAIALKWSENHKSGTGQEVFRSASSVLNMINRYGKKEEHAYEGLVSASLEQPVHLEAVLNLDEQPPRISFQVGRAKLYIMKNVDEFFDAYEKGNPITYGKGFAFTPVEEAFIGEDRAVFQFICHKMERYRQENPSVSSYTYGYSAPKRKDFPLYGEDIDRILKIYVGRELAVCREGTTDKVRVVEEDPNLTVYLKSKGKDGLTLYSGEPFVLLDGEMSCGIVLQDTLYVCSDSYRENCLIFLSELSESYRLGDKTLDIHKRDMSDFCRLVLPAIEQLITVERTDTDLEEYRPKALIAKFYLDMPKPDCILCEVSFSYGNVEFNPLKNESISDVIRDNYKEKRIESIITRYFRYMDEKYRLIIQDNEDELYTLIDKGIEELMKVGEVFVSDELKRIRQASVPKVSIGVSIRGDMLDLKVDADGMSSKELFALLSNYRKKKKYFRLKNGDYLRMQDVDVSAVDELTEGLKLKEKDFSDKPVSVPKNRALFLDKVLDGKANIKFYANDDYQQMIRNLNVGMEKQYPLPESLQGILREYQVNGYQWLKMLHEYGFGGILADDMGLGKTLQVIAVLLSEQKPESPSLVCCPASLVYNWYNECLKYAPQLNCVTVAGDATERKQIIRDYKQYDVLITSYDLLRRDIEEYQDCHFAFQIIDEAQFIKNQNTQNAHAVKQIDAVTRYALTGTPIENRLSELWSIFDYLMNGYLYSYPMFKADLEMPIVKSQDENATKRLQRLIAPFILRRLKKDVLKDLPDKQEETVYSRMEGEQKRLYAAVANHLLKSLNDSSDIEFQNEKLEILAGLMKLRQVCCDPALCFEDYESGSVKLDTCIQLIEQAIEGEHKILLFSQFTSMLERIASELAMRGISHYILTGETPKKKRLEVVEAFQQDHVPVFLISLRAGGTGLNLTAADVVIHYDPWWNVAVQNQATDRSHRIGQERKVNVYKLIVKDTIEDKILALQEAKKSLAEDILNNEMTSLGKLSREELIELLK